MTLGKLAGTSLGAIYGLVAMLPFLAVTLLLGGITGADYARMSLVLLLPDHLATGIALRLSSPSMSGVPCCWHSC